MKIEKIADGTTVTISLEGWLDTTTSPELKTEIDALDSTVTTLILDFEKLEYISSAGLRQVVSAYIKMKDGELKIVNVSKGVMEVFKMAGFDKKLNIQ